MSEIRDNVREWQVIANRAKLLEWVERDPFAAACALDMLQYGGVVAVAEDGHIWLNGRGSGYGCYGRLRGYDESR